MLTFPKATKSYASKRIPETESLSFDTNPTPKEHGPKGIHVSSKFVSDKSRLLPVNGCNWLHVNGLEASASNQRTWQLWPSEALNIFFWPVCGRPSVLTRGWQWERMSLFGGGSSLLHGVWGATAQLLESRSLKVFMRNIVIFLCTKLSSKWTKPTINIGGNKKKNDLGKTWNPEKSSIKRNPLLSSLSLGNGLLNFAQFKVATIEKLSNRTELQI